MALTVENLGIHANKQGWGELAAKTLIPREVPIKAPDSNTILKTPLN